MFWNPVERRINVLKTCVFSIRDFKKNVVLRFEKQEGRLFNERVYDFG